MTKLVTVITVMLWPGILVSMLSSYQIWNEYSPIYRLTNTNSIACGIPAFALARILGREAGTYPTMRVYAVLDISKENRYRGEGEPFSQSADTLIKRISSAASIAKSVGLFDCCVSHSFRPWWVTSDIPHIKPMEEFATSRIDESGVLQNSTHTSWNLQLREKCGVS